MKATTDRNDPLEALAQFARGVGAVAIAADASAVAERLHRRTLFVAVIGLPGVGKTTLVNALAGARLLPTEVQTVPLFAVSVRYGPSSRVRVDFRNEASREVAVTHLDRFISSSGNFDNRREVRGIEVAAPNTALRGMSLIDVPHPLSARRERLAIAPHVDIVLSVIEAGSTFSRDAVRIASSLGVGVGNLGIVVTRSDRSPAATERTITTIRRFNQSANIFAISAEAALNGTLAPEWTRLISFIEQRANRIGANNVESAREEGFRTYAARIRRYLEEQHRALTTPCEDSERRILALERRATLIARVVEQRPDDSRDREHLADNLRTRRRMFLMSIKADAIELLGERAKLTAVPKSKLHSAMANLAQEVAEAAVVRWSEKIRLEVEKRLEPMHERFLATLLSELEDLQDSSGNDAAIAPSTLLRVSNSPQPTMPRLPRRWIPDMLRTENTIRCGAEQQSIRVLDELIHSHSLRVVNDWLRFFDDSRSALASSLSTSLHVTVALARAATDRAAMQGADDVTVAIEATQRAIEQLDELTRRLTNFDRSRTERS